MNNPFSTLTKKEWLLWLCSLFIVLVSNILAANFDPLTLIAALVGVTSLVFAAKGNVWAQVLMIVFSILYGIMEEFLYFSCSEYYRLILVCKFFHTEDCNNILQFFILLQNSLNFSCHIVMLLAYYVCLKYS